MASILPTFPDQPDTVVSVELEEVVYRIRLRWSERRAGWYLDLLTEGGDPIITGRRLCPRESPLEGVSDGRAPRGRLMVTGPDEYFQGDLGRSLLIVYVNENEKTPPVPSKLVIS